MEIIKKEWFAEHLDDTIEAINHDAAVFFKKALYEPAGKNALEYLRKERGFTDDIIRDFGLGYADRECGSLTDYLISRGYSPVEISVAGLCDYKDDRYYDFFRNRVMIPIIDKFGQVLGFGGRAIDSDDNRKYLLTSYYRYSKQRKNFYNLNLSLTEGKHQSYPILVEGFMDVIALFSFGFANSVATLGTALTLEQARLIKRYYQTIYVSYDGDEAGQNATLKAVDILNSVGIEPRVVLIPGGQDPDEFLREHGSAAYKKLLESSVGRIEYKLITAKKEYDTSSDDGIEKYLKDAVEILKAEKNPVTTEKYCRLLAKETGYTEEAIKRSVEFTESHIKKECADKWTTSMYDGEIISELIDENMKLQMQITELLETEKEKKFSDGRKEPIVLQDELRHRIFSKCIKSPDRTDYYEKTEKPGGYALFQIVKASGLEISQKAELIKEILDVFFCLDNPEYPENFMNEYDEIVAKYKNILNALELTDKKEQDVVFLSVLFSKNGCDRDGENIRTESKISYSYNIFNSFESAVKSFKCNASEDFDCTENPHTDNSEKCPVRFEISRFDKDENGQYKLSVTWELDRTGKITGFNDEEEFRRNLLSFNEADSFSHGSDNLSRI